MMLKNSLLIIGMAAMLLNVSCTQKAGGKALDTKNSISSDEGKDGKDGKKGAATTPKEKAKDSDEIKAATVYKISFVDLPGLVNLSGKADTVVHRQKISSEAVLSQKIKTMNEESFCKILIKGTFHSEDFLKLEDHELREIDKENDVFQTLLKFKNANGEIQFTCTHTTPNFYIEEFYQNMQPWLDMYDIETNKVNLVGYVNPRTENRMLNAIKISDVEKLEKIIIQEDRKQLFAMEDGQIKDMDEASALVANGDGKMSCAILYVVGQLSRDKVFIRVEKGVAEETPAHVSTATIYAIYRADAENLFALTCLVKKTTSWSELMNTGKNILQFGVLERPAYNKKYDEVLEIHKELKEKK